MSGECDSDSGFSSGSSTSTYRCRQELFDTFQKKLTLLARGLGDVVDMSLQRRHGGGHNSVVLSRLKTKAGDSVPGIFRIPRLPEIAVSPELEQSDEYGFGQHTSTSILAQAAILQLLGSRSVPAPRLLAFDALGVNAIASPYTLQMFSTGVPMPGIYALMSKQEKLSVTDGLAALLLSLESIRVPHSGSIVTRTGSKSDVKHTFLLEFGAPNLEIGVRDIQTTDPDVPVQSLVDLLTRKVRYWQKQESTLEEVKPMTAMLERLSKLIFAMQTRSIFALQNTGSTDIERNVLCHRDLESRNILVKRNIADEKWEIDVVIGWEKVVAVPPVLVRKPPAWLWNSSSELKHTFMRSDYDGDADLLRPSGDDAEAERLSADDQEIRQHFENAIIQGLADIYKGYSTDAYMEEAYRKGRWIRQIARFAFHGATNSQDVDRFDRVHEDWREYREALDARSATEQKWQKGHARHHSAWRFLQSFFRHSQNVA